MEILQNNKQYAAFSLFILLLFSSGCIEHTFNISVLPEDSIEIVYHAKGDVMDFNDSGQLMPDSTVWKVRSWLEEKEEEKVHHVEASITINDASRLDEILNWQQTQSDTLHLKHDLQLGKHPNLFGTTWRFSGILYSRRFDETYGDIWDFVPEECRALEDDERKNSLSTDETKILEEKFTLGIIQWNLDRYTKLFDHVWKSAVDHQPDLCDASETTLSIARAGWVEDLHQYLNGLNLENPNTMNLDWWNELRPVFLGRMVDITGPHAVDLLTGIGNAIEREYQTSKDIEDDSYRFIVSLPGKTTSSNGSKHDEGGILYEFPGKELLNNDGIMIASSFEISIWRVVVAAFLLIFALNLIRRALRKRG